MPAPPARPVALQDESVTLREYQPEDLDRLLAAFADPDLQAWNPGATTADGALDWMRRRNDWTDGAHASWAAADATGLLVGSVSLHQLDVNQGDSQIGYWTSPDSRHRGIATAAVRLAVGWAFRELGLHRIYLYHAVDNASSCRVAGTAGFRLEGVLLQSYRYADGGYHDEHLHALLCSEWREMIRR